MPTIEAMSTSIDTDPEQSRRDGWVVFNVVLALVAVVGATVAIGLGTRAVKEADDAGTNTPAAAATAHISLSDLKITPDTVEVSAGASLHVSNDGKMQHNLSVKATDLRTAMLNPGEQGTL